MLEKDAKTSRASRSTPTTPEDYPTSPLKPTKPVGISALDHSFLIQAVYEIRGAIGELKQSTESLGEQVKSHSGKLERLGNDVHAAKVVIGLVGGFIGLVGIFLGIVLKALLDYLLRTQLK